MVLSPFSWQRFVVPDLKSVASCAVALLALSVAQFITISTAIAVDPQSGSRTAPQSNHGTLGAGAAVQLHRDCVLGNSVSACTALIEQSKTPGVTNAYSVAAAYYKRGRMKALQNRPKDALDDYRKASALFSFPQLALEIARVERQLSQSAVKKKPAAKGNTTPKPTPWVAGIEKAIAAGKTPAQKKRREKTRERRTTKPLAKSTAAPVNKATAPPQKANVATAQVKTDKPSARNRKTSISFNAAAVEPWETITERVIHRYHAKNPRQTAPPVTRIFSELRGSCERPTAAGCQPNAKELSIANSDFSTAPEHETEESPAKRLTVSAYQKMTTGSLPSFQVMSGLEPIEETPTEQAAPTTAKPAVAKEGEMTVTAQSVKVSMIARPVLVSRGREAPPPRWAPSLLHYFVLLIICSTSIGALWLRHQRFSRLATIAGRIRDKVGAPGRYAYAGADLSLPGFDFRRLRGAEPGTDLNERGAEQPPPIPAPEPVSAPAPAPVPLPSTAGSTIGSIDVEAGNQIDLLGLPPDQPDPPPVSQPLDAELLARIATELENGVRASQPPPIPIAREEEPEPEAEEDPLSKPLEAEQLEGNVLIIASDDEKRQRLLRSALKAIAANSSFSARPIIALDSTGRLEKMLRADEQFQDRVAVVDWNTPESAGSLNPFKMIGLDDEPLAREQALNKSFEMQCHVCEGFLGAEFVAQNRSQLRHLFRLMATVPNADFTTLRELLVKRDVSKYERFIGELKSKSSRDFFKSEFLGRGFERAAGSIVAKLDQLLDDETFSNAVLEPSDRDNDHEQLHTSGKITIVPIPVEQLQSMANSVLRRMALARVMQHWPVRTTQSAVPEGTTLVIDTLSHFELPDFLGFNQLLKEFMQNGSRIIVCVSDPSELPAGNFGLVARLCSSKIVDGSFTSQRQTLSDKLGIHDVVLEDRGWDAAEEQALLLRIGDDSEEAVIVGYN